MLAIHISLKWEKEWGFIEEGTNFIFLSQKADEGVEGRLLKDNIQYLEFTGFKYLRTRTEII